MPKQNLFRKTEKAFSVLLIIFLGTIAFSCSSKTPVKNLTSDICLIIPENNTKEDVQAILGKPDIIRFNEQNGKAEEWIYYQSHKSFLKKMPLVSKKFGTEEYDVVIVTFRNERVTACFYRSLVKDELSEHGVKLDGPTSEE